MSNRRTDLLRNPSFLWLFGGGALSMLGDQFTLIALPWVVLKLTGDPLAMGTVLATMAVPRAVLMLAGGALVDLSSAKRVLLATKYANAACLGLLAYLILAHSVSLRAIYLIALATGIVSAFSYPAGSAIIPQVVPSTQLQPANGLLMGMRQATQLLGPLLAGAVIAVFGDGNVRLGHSYRGLAVAFLIDCATFLLSAATLYKVASHSQMPGTSQSQGVFASIRNGLQALWRDQGLRAICLYSAATAFLTGGPVQVALPVVADRNLSNGAAAYGSMLAAYGAGSLIGMAVSGARPTWRLRSLGATILLIDAVAAFVLMPLGKIETVWQGVFLVGALGVLGGLIQVGV